MLINSRIANNYKYDCIIQTIQSSPNTDKASDEHSSALFALLIFNILHNKIPHSFLSTYNSLSSAKSLQMTLFHCHGSSGYETTSLMHRVGLALMQFQSQGCCGLRTTSSMLMSECSLIYLHSQFCSGNRLIISIVKFGFLLI